MILILFIVLLIIILLYIYIQSKNHFKVNIIKGTEVKDSNFKDNLKNTNIYLGERYHWRMPKNGLALI